MPKADDRASIVDLVDITKVYGSGDAEVDALRGVSLTVKAGEFVAITGPSGSGKSTLMHILGCLDTPTSGAYWFGGEDVSTLNDNQLAHVRNRRIGFVFQQFHLLPRMNAVANVELPLLYRSSTNRRDAALLALEHVGLADRVNHRPNQLSGGQQQRVAIARALVTDPDIVLADEPTGNLDSHSQHEILGLFQELNDQGRTVILITHEPDVAAVAKRTIHVRDGQILDEVAA
jgi:putative ABC transport system ATP-binding protein